MIPSSSNSPQRTVKAVGLLSGGLDSSLAAKLMVDLGVEVHAVYFAQPWGCCDKQKAQAMAERLGITFVPLQLDERYLDVIQNPRYGYGRALNPCRDCRIHMFTRAAEYMRSIGGGFVFTGEVLGQRPMSQMRDSMRIIERDSGLEGRLLRPLCAQLLEPTIPEKEGRIDRERLLKISGRSRKDQLRLAEEFGITDFPAPAGGCLLTNEPFANRMRDVFKYGYRNFRETIALKWGRHFRVSAEFKIVVGRDEEENLALVRYAHPEDYVLELETHYGPVAIVKGENPSADILTLAAGLIQRYSRYKETLGIVANCWLLKDKNQVRKVQSLRLNEDTILQMSIA